MFQYNIIDSRLEGRLINLYHIHQERAAKIDWSYHEFILGKKLVVLRRSPGKKARGPSTLEFILLFNGLF